MYINTATQAYPLSEQDVRSAHPNVSGPMPYAGYAWVFSTPQPAFNSVTQMAREITPVLTVKGTWEQAWEVVKRYDNQADEDAAVAADNALKVKAIESAIITATQLRLDTFAQTRNYMGILSACTYASSTVEKFKTEGQYCVNQRDATWAKLYQMLAEVQAGTRPMPSGYADIESELPVLVWP